MVDEVNIQYNNFEFFWRFIFFFFAFCCCFLSSINRLSSQNVRKLLDLIKGQDTLNTIDAEDIANKYNADILFPPGKLCKMNI